MTEDRVIEGITLKSFRTLLSKFGEDLDDYIVKVATPRYSTEDNPKELNMIIIDMDVKTITFREK